MEPREVHGRVVTRLSDVPWPCGVCGDGRDFDDLHVVQRLIPMDNGANMTINVGYCRDRPACAARAEQEADSRARVFGQTFTCPACDAKTLHPRDVEARYCPRCRWWTGDPLLGPARPDLFERNGRKAPTFGGLPPGTGRGFHADLVLLDEVLGDDA